MDRLESQLDGDGMFCSTSQTTDGDIRIRGSVRPPQAPVQATLWTDTLLDWGETWMWDNLTVEGEEDWILESIREGDCVAVTDGSYMDGVDSTVCSAAFIFECQKKRGRITGSFCEQSSVACSYRGELLGLLAIHLILASVCTANEGFQGAVEIYSDCKAALWTLENLPPTSIPARFRHADILKIILIHCKNESLDMKYEHVVAHQDDEEEFEYLSRPSQLNCMMDLKAKQAILDWEAAGRPSIQRKLPREALVIRVGKEKVTSNSGDLVRFWAHRSIARSLFLKRGIFYSREFDLIDWEAVGTALGVVPRLFQIWACKQVMGIAGTFKFRSRYEQEMDPMCPSCQVEEEDCGHILRCREEGRVAALVASLDALEEWLEETDTDPILVEGIMSFLRGRGEGSLEDSFIGYPREYRTLGMRQDRIGWRRFMEGMIVADFRRLQIRHLRRQGLRNSGDKWAREFIIKLLECTHGQWLYRNVVVYDQLAGTEQVRRKEEVRAEIIQQLELGGDTLREEDQYLLDINLGDMETGGFRQQEYWLRTIQAARIAKQISEDAIGIG